MEKNNVEISYMNDNDLAALKTTLISDYDDFWNYETLEKEVHCESSTYIVAKHKDEIVGFAGIKQIIDEADIMNIVTKKNCRKMGIGSLLLQSLVKTATEKNMKTITLEVNENNIPAIKLYEKFGFEHVGLRKKYYNNTDSAILMTLSL